MSAPSCRCSSGSRTSYDVVVMAAPRSGSGSRRYVLRPPGVSVPAGGEGGPDEEPSATRWRLAVAYGSCGAGASGISELDAVGHGIVSGPPSGVFSAGS
jgi:hypothetical protein